MRAIKSVTFVTDFFLKMYTYGALSLFTHTDISLTQIEGFTHESCHFTPCTGAGGGAVAYPALSGAASQGLIGITRRAFSLLLRHRANVLLMALAILAILAILAFALPHLVRAEDLLASQKADAKDTLGHGSTVEWGLYIAEIILSVGAYIKVRNPMILVGGIPFLIVITRVFFSLAG